MSDLISRQTALSTIEANQGTLNKRKVMKILEGLPSAQHENKRQATVSSDCISRKDAIDIGRRATVDTNPSHFEAHQKFMQFMDDAEISSFGRWEWSNGFNTALTAINVDLRRLPSAEPEIIRCKNCKYWRQQTNYIGVPLSFGFCESDNMWRSLYGETCEVSHIDTDDDFYCGYAERRTDE